MGWLLDWARAKLAKIDREERRRAEVEALRTAALRRTLFAQAEGKAVAEGLVKRNDFLRRVSEPKSDVLELDRRACLKPFSHGWACTLERGHDGPCSTSNGMAGFLRQSPPDYRLKAQIMHRRAQAAESALNTSANIRADLERRLKTEQNRAREWRRRTQKARKREAHLQAIIDQQARRIFEEVLQVEANKQAAKELRDEFYRLNHGGQSPPGWDGPA